MKRANLTNQKELKTFFSKTVTLFINFGINFGKLRRLDFLTGGLIFLPIRHRCHATHPNNGSSFELN